jgi:glutathionylspermidine synthase
MTLHNKFKVYYRNREYKNVYEKLLKLEKPEQTYMILYLEDLVSSVNKMLREYIVHKEVNSSSNVQACILQGKDTLFKLYKLFTFNEEITNQRKSVCLELQNSITRFLNIIISFTLKSAVICMIQNKTCQAKSIYEALYCICSSVLTSTTSVSHTRFRIIKYCGK